MKVGYTCTLVLTNLVSHASAILMESKPHHRPSQFSTRANTPTTRVTWPDFHVEKQECRVVMAGTYVGEFSLGNMRTDFCSPSTLAYILEFVGQADGTMTRVNNFERDTMYRQHSDDDRKVDLTDWQNDILNGHFYFKMSNLAYGFTRRNRFAVKATGNSGKHHTHDCGEEPWTHSFDIAVNEAAQYCRDIKDSDAHADYWKKYAPELHYACAVAPLSEQALKDEYRTRALLYVMHLKDERMATLRAIANIAEKELRTHKESHKKAFAIALKWKTNVGVIHTHVNSKFHERVKELGLSEETVMKFAREARKNKYHSKYEYNYNMQEKEQGHNHGHRCHKH